MDLNEKELIEQARMMGVPAHEFAAKFVTRDLVEATLTAVRKVVKLKENQEGKLIDQLNEDVKGLITAAVAVIAAAGTSAITCTMKSYMGTGKSLRVVLDTDGDDPQRHALTDRVNNRVLLVLAPDEYYGALDSNKPQKDQPDLPLNESQPLDDDEIIEGEDSLYGDAIKFVTDSKRASISAVQRHLKIGYNRAARMIETMEQQGIVTAMNSNGAREVIGQAEPISPYELAFIHVTNGGAITAKAIQEAAGVKRKEVTDIILALASNGIISDPDEEGLRTLVPSDKRPMTAAEVKHGHGSAGKVEDVADIVEANPWPVTEAAAEKAKANVGNFSEDQYMDAVLLVQREKKVSTSFIKSNFAVDEETAEAIIMKMEQDGIVSAENDIGGRAIYD